MTEVTNPPQKPEPSWRSARPSSQAIAFEPHVRMGPTGTRRASRGTQVETRPAFIRSPRIDIVAGRNVRLPSTETRTTPIVPIAIDVNSDTSRVTRPASEIITARPEKKTARPAVLLETSIDFARSRPARRSTRKRVIMNNE